MIPASLALLLLGGVARPDEPAQGPKALYDAGKKLSARRVATEALQADPDDVEAHLIAALVLWEEDGRHAQALARLQLADRLYERREAELGDEGWRLQWQILRNMAFLASEMGRDELFLATAERFNDRYLPKIEAEQAWTLMMKGRLTEARAIAERGIASDDPWQRRVGWNTLCAIDARDRDRTRMVETCERSLELAVADREDDPVTALRNGGVAARSTLRFERAEELFVRAARGAAGGWTNPWSDLVSLYIDQGRGADAANAAVQMQRWRMAQTGADRAQTRAKDDAILATLLLVAGEVDRARALLDRCLAFPDRAESSTATEATTRGGHTLLRLVARRAQAERAAERAAEAGWWAALGHRVAALVPDWGAIADRATVRAALLDAETLRATFGEVDEGRLIGVPAWALGELAPIVGSGVARAALGNARRAAILPGLESYFDAYIAELDARAGGDAASTARAAEALPSQEALLRARLYALAAIQARRAGDRPAELAHLERATQIDPGTLRRLGIALPVAIAHDGSAPAARAASNAAWSPRFRPAHDGFRLSFTESAACLATPTGAAIGCYAPASAPPERAGAAPAQGVTAPPTTADAAAALLAAAHDGAFALPLGLSTHDLRSLDGSTVLDRARHRERMDKLIDGL